MSDERKRSIVADNLKLVEARMKRDSIDFFVPIAILSFGVIVAMIGFQLWYWKDQTIRDELLSLELQAMRTGMVISVLNNKNGALSPPPSGESNPEEVEQESDTEVDSAPVKPMGE